MVSVWGEVCAGQIVALSMLMTLRSQISISIITNLDVSHLPTQNIRVLAVNNKSEYYLWLIVSEMFRSKINFQFGNIPTPTEHVVDVQKAQTMFCFLCWTEVSAVWQSNTREHWRQRIKLTARLSLDKTSNINHHQLCEAPAQLIRWHEFYMRFDITEPAPDFDTNWYQLILRLIQVWQKRIIQLACFSDRRQEMQALTFYVSLVGNFVLSERTSQFLLLISN